MQFKDGAQPPLMHIQEAIRKAEDQLRIDGVIPRELTVTAGINGAHSEWSGHFQLRAIDVRVRDIPRDNWERVRGAIELQMERVFPVDRVYVGLHDPDGPNVHIHVQFK